MNDGTKIFYTPNFNDNIQYFVKKEENVRLRFLIIQKSELKGEDRKHTNENEEESLEDDE